MSKSLVNITRDLLIAKQDAEIFDDEQALKRVDEICAERYRKANGMQYLYGEIDGEIGLFTKQLNKLKSYIKFLKNSQERLKTYVISQYNETGELPSHDVFNPIKIRQSSGAVDIIEEVNIPMEYFIEVKTYKLDKKRLLADLKEGKDIPGARLVKKDYVKGIK
jgi:hypothetical protein